jgi:hypothetical protein
MVRRLLNKLTKVRFVPQDMRMFIQWVCISIYAWPLILKLPYTLRSVYEAFRPDGGNLAEKDFWAFGPRDAGFRPWYLKIARDYHTQGRFGYVWDDGLGMPLGARIYNNLATYNLLYWLGTRRMMGLGFIIMVVSCALLIGWQINLWVGLVVGVLGAGSPLLIGSYTHLGKPEVFWWGFAVPTIFFLLSGSPLLAGLLWSLIACANLSVSVMLALVLGFPILFLLSGGELFLLMLGTLPGIIKHGTRGIYMWRTGFLTSLASEQSRLWKRPWYPLSLEVVVWLPFMASIALSAYASQQIVVGGALLLSTLGLYWVNFRVIYLNDEQSFHLALWVIGLCYAAATHSIFALLPIIALTYIRPSLCGFPNIELESVTSKPNSWHQRLHRAKLQMQYYPRINPISFYQPPQLAAFFACIPDQVRILLESDGDPRSGSRFRGFEQWMEHFLPTRQVDLANEMYTRFVEPELVDQYLTNFNADKMSIMEMKTLCQALGVSYVITHSSSTKEALEDIGFVSIAQVDLVELSSFRSLFAVPPVMLSLLKNPEDVTVISPAVSWKRSGNDLSWNGKAGQTYLVRYRYHTQFLASQDHHQIPVERYMPLNEIPCCFVQVRAVIDGQIVLKFCPKWM